jgi:hypothetical protein
MNARLILLWCFALLLITGPQHSSIAANAPTPGLVGRYSDGSNPPTYIDLRADGTVSVTQGPHSMSGTYTAQGNNLTVSISGRPPAPFQYANGVLTAPDEMVLHRIGEPAAPAAGTGNAGAVDQLALMRSINHVKQLCLACKLWAAEHQGVFPDSVDQIMSPKYLGDNPDYGIVHCPLLHDENQPGYAYLGKGQKDSENGGPILFLSRWQDSTGHRVVGHASAAVGLEIPKLEDLPAALRARAATPAQPAVPVGTPARVPTVVGRTQTWHPWSSAVQPSHPTGDLFMLTFTNHQSSPVKLYWLSQKGGTYYGDIAPGATWKQQVRKGAVWYAANSAGVQLGYFVIEEGANQAVIPER